MIQLIGHNEIVVNLAATLRNNSVPFQVFSNKDISFIGPEFLQVETISQLEAQLIKVSEPCLRISAGAPWIFNKTFLQKFEPQGIFNIHGTPLPLDRGGTIVSWLILNKKRIGNAVIHKIVDAPDAGPILLTKEYIYPVSCHFPADYIHVYNKQQELLATALCLDWVQGKLNVLQVSEQASYLSSYWPRLNATLNAWINWDWDGEEIELFIRAFDEPYKGAMAVWRGQTIFLKKSFFQKDANYHPFQWGLVYRIRRINDIRYMAVAVKGGTLYIESCMDENGNDMLSKIKEGDRLYHTDELLIASKKRTVKTNDGFGPQQDIT
jgi:methionyl-tRNA formyltransferase